MKTKRWIAPVALGVLGLFAVLFALWVGRPGKDPQPTLPGTHPTLSLDETSAKEFVITDFGAVHAQVAGDANKYLVFGNLPVSKPAADLPAGLAAFLGRWEGYGYGPPVKKDRKVVLAIQDLTALEGNAALWSGTNLQFPDQIDAIHFRVHSGDAPAIEFQITLPDGSKGITTFTYDHEKDILRGSATFPPSNSNAGPFELTRDRSFYVYKDYTSYLASKRIYSKIYRNEGLRHYGSGYLLYLPEGYEDHPEKTWPLIFFLHGIGDRGNNILLLAKASPFMFIREQGPLPFIIAAPLLSAMHGDSTFPAAYMDGALAEIQADYRVDAHRIYGTGLSMGGESIYRFAVHRPDTFAAIVPLSAFSYDPDPAKMSVIKDLPIWAIHGADDSAVPLQFGQQPVDALRAAGSDIKFTVLPGHDHDVWTDTYSDPKFYDWLLQQRRP